MKGDTFRMQAVGRIILHLLSRNRWGIVSQSAVFLCMYTILIVTNSNANVEIFFSLGSMPAAWLAMGAFVGGTRFQTFRPTNGWLSMLRLPASALEKAVAMLAHALISFHIIFVVPILIAWALGVVLNHVSWSYAWAAFDLLSPTIRLCYIAGLSTVPLGVLLVVNRNMVSRVIWIVVFVATIVFVPAITLALFRGTPVLPLMGTHASSIVFDALISPILISNSFVSALTTTLLLLLIPLAIYFRLKESEA